MLEEHTLAKEEKLAMLAELTSLFDATGRVEDFFYSFLSSFDLDDGYTHEIGTQVTHHVIADQNGLIHWIRPVMYNFLVELVQKPTLTLRDCEADFLAHKLEQVQPGLSVELLLLKPRQKAFEQWRTLVLSQQGIHEPAAAVEVINKSAQEFKYKDVQAWDLLSQVLESVETHNLLFDMTSNMFIDTLCAFSCRPANAPKEIKILKEAAQLFACKVTSGLQNKLTHSAAVTEALHYGYSSLNSENDKQYGEALLHVIPYCPVRTRDEKRKTMIDGAVKILKSPEGFSNHKALVLLGRLDAIFAKHGIGGPLTDQERQNTLSRMSLSDSDIPF